MRDWLYRFAERRILAACYSPAPKWLCKWRMIRLHFWKDVFLRTLDRIGR